MKSASQPAAAAHGATLQPRSIPPPHYHGNGMHQIKSFSRSIQIFPSSSLILLILPALTQALFGSLWAFPHHTGKVRAEKTAPMFNTEITAVEN